MPGGHAVITLTDGSQLELGESSNLVIDNHALAPTGGRAATQVSLFGGVLRSVVNATGGPPNFEVHTPNAVAAVRGTRFDTVYIEGESRPTFGDCRKFTDVVVYEGVVSVRNPGAATGEEIPAGYEAQRAMQPDPDAPRSHRHDRCSFQHRHRGRRRSAPGLPRMPCLYDHHRPYADAAPTAALMLDLLRIELRLINSTRNLLAKALLIVLAVAC